MAAALKRTKSLTDFFRPARSRSPAPPPANAAPPPARPAPGHPSTASSSRTLRPPDADSYVQLEPQNQSHALPPIETSFTRSGTVDDILGAYGDSPTKARFPADPQRFDSSYTASTTASGSTSRDEIAEMPVLDHRDDRAGLRSSQPQSQRNSRSRPSGASRAKSSSELDVIDRLDISGLYGGGSFVRHEGPYAAASTSRNHGSLAPIAAFDPSAFTLAPSPASSSAASSMRRAQSSGVPTGASPLLGSRADGPYAAAKASAGGSGGARDISLGFPAAREDRSGKGAQLLEIYGVRDNEAWEDFGQARYDSKAASRESVVPSGVSKEDRMLRTQSIWDIEATLKAGKPVGQAPPPVPVIPNEWSPPEVSPSNKPKRSKSLAARFRAGRKNPNNPLGDDLTVQTGLDDSREAGGAHSVPVSPVEDRRGARGEHWPLAASMPASAGGGGGGSRPSSRADERALEQLESRTGALRFEDAPLPERPSGLGRVYTDDSAGSPTTGKKEKGGLKRLFSTKRKS
ncbi:hypothetical protein JCM10450v2_000489 [Rhodotorula kratochvilovae]